jgi:hypothetical protein
VVVIAKAGREVRRQVGVDQRRIEDAADAAGAGRGQDGVLLGDIAAVGIEGVDRGTPRRRRAGDMGRCRCRGIELHHVKRVRGKAEVAAHRHEGAGRGPARRERAIARDRGIADGARAHQRATGIHRGQRGGNRTGQVQDAGIHVDGVYARDGVGIGEGVARAERKVHRVAGTLADDVAGNGAAGDVHRVGQRRQQDGAGDGAAHLADRRRRALAAIDRRQIDRRSAGAGDVAAVGDAARDGAGAADDNAGLCSDAPLIGYSTGERGGKTGEPDRGLIADENTHTGGTIDRASRSVGDAIFNSSSDQGDAGKTGAAGERPTIADAAGDVCQTSGVGSIHHQDAVPGSCDRVAVENGTPNVAEGEDPNAVASVGIDRTGVGNIPGDGTGQDVAAAEHGDAITAGIHDPAVDDRAAHGGRGQ